MDTRQSNNLEPAGHDDRIEVTKYGFTLSPYSTQTDVRPLSGYGPSLSKAEGGIMTQSGNSSLQAVVVHVEDSDAPAYLEVQWFQFRRADRISRSQFP